MSTDSNIMEASSSHSVPDEITMPSKTEHMLRMEHPDEDDQEHESNTYDNEQEDEDSIDGRNDSGEEIDDDDEDIKSEEEESFGDQAESAGNDSDTEGGFEVDSFGDDDSIADPAVSSSLESTASIAVQTEQETEASEGDSTDDSDTEAAVDSDEESEALGSDSGDYQEPDTADETDEETEASDNVKNQNSGEEEEEAFGDEDSEALDEEIESSDDSFDNEQDSENDENLSKPADHIEPNEGNNSTNVDDTEVQTIFVSSPVSEASIDDSKVTDTGSTTTTASITSTSNENSTTSTVNSILLQKITEIVTPIAGLVVPPKIRGSKKSRRKKNPDSKDNRQRLLRLRMKQKELGVL